MAEDSADGQWIGARELNQPIATRLGVYIAQMTGFELCILGMFRNLARIEDRAVSAAIFGRIINMTTRIEILDALLDACPEPGLSIRVAHRVAHSSI
jgi:hypothetical protein